MINTLNLNERKKRQKFLKERGFYSRAIDGDWGKYSKIATKSFQKWAKAKGYYPFKIDGEWGNETEKAYKSVAINSKTKENDVSNEEILITYGTFFDMETRYNKFKKKNKVEPKTIYLIFGGKNYITNSRFKDMQNRVEKYKKENPKEALNNVWIKKPKIPENILTNNNKNNLPSVIIKNKTYKLTNFTEFYDLMGGFGYAYYYNDILTLTQEIKALSIGKAMNCTDFAQLGVYIASQFKKDGKQIYTTRYVHINCQSGGGHTTFQIKGGEFGDKWVMIDLAAKADKNSRIYPIGDYWCKTGKIRGYNELWVLVDNGVT